MTTRTRFLALGALALFAVPAQAQTKSDTSTLQPIKVQYMRPFDRRGMNMFETPKIAGPAYTGFQIQFGAAFTQQFQALDHENTAEPRVVSGVNQNQLIKIGNGFNNANANLYINTQLAKGIRVQLTTYLSSRRHNDTWVKDGFIQIDDSPFDVKLLQDMMKVLTVKIGHMEVNYGDQHFRRSDNGNALMNPFIGNSIMDAFTTEVGTEIIAQKNGFLGVAAFTNGEIRGNIVRPRDRGPAHMYKVGYDKQINKDLRVRLTGSYRGQASAISNTLYGGDRAGSRFYFVMENTAATESANPTSGAINPGFSDVLKATMINPFIKYRGLELFGLIENARGRNATETVNRKVDQQMFEAVYRFWGEERLFVGGRTQRWSGRLAGQTADNKIGRMEVGGGWFITPSLLMKAEYVNQKYTDFPTTDILNGGKFKGFMIEGVVAF
ncbi:MAG: hypothetical protein K2X99_12670 [Gemmatimonadaceae bacterium]|nr:hypothetical protein [Gemmatimonadaceae bacterium]